MWTLFRPGRNGAERTEPRAGDAPTAAVPVRDRRVQPSGVMPQHAQAWLLIGMAVLMVAIIAFSGRSGGRPVRLPALTAPAEPNQARIEDYQRRLDEAARRLRTEQDALERAQQESQPHRGASRGAAQADGAAAPGPRERDRSFWADNVAFTRRREERTIEAARAAGVSSDRAVQARSTAATALDQALERSSAGGTAVVSSEASDAVIPAGTLIEAVLLNRLDGTFAGPVMASVAVPVYAQDGDRVLIPQGARVLGEAAPVSVFGQSRLAVTFHRLQWPAPDRRAIDLDQFKGLNETGQTGLQDHVDRHYLRLFGASAALGLLAGFTQYGTRSGLDESFADAYRQAAGVNIAQSGTRLFDRFLSILPTVTIREGHRILIYISKDLQVPPAMAPRPALP